ncbi:GNAT family N-acetyltransferase [Bordetella flabilis]|uniref:N-acetyltransferase domain-containing protein n=1 Tax=Bordetella flabilis TaxID=463014 RepID=A0A193GIH7_9BORD|nr:GNAT family N-acetyltransferase [Bordetella flabilis]ANN79079.1 hypothetical protein BAU07_19900 [Bordetella flabilis]
MSAPPYRILPISPAHIDGYRRTLDAVARERRYLAFLEAPSLEQTQDFVLRNIERGNPHLVAVAEESVIGWCDIVPLTHPGFAHTGVVGMGVHADWRGRGVGKALLRAGAGAARQAGLQRLELEVYASNDAACRLYEAHGFVREGLKRRGRCLDGAYEDIVIMARLLP